MPLSHWGQAQQSSTVGERMVRYFDTFRLLIAAFRMKMEKHSALRGNARTYSNQWERAIALQVIGQVGLFLYLSNANVANVFLHANTIRYRMIQLFQAAFRSSSPAPWQSWQQWQRDKILQKASKVEIMSAGHCTVLLLWIAKLFSGSCACEQPVLW